MTIIYFIEFFAAISFLPAWISLSLPSQSKVLRASFISSLSEDIITYMKNGFGHIFLLISFKKTSFVNFLILPRFTFLPVTLKKKFFGICPPLEYWVIYCNFNIIVSKHIINTIVSNIIVIFWLLYYYIKTRHFKYQIPKSNPLWLYSGSDKQIQGIISDRHSAWWTMHRGSWHCAGGSNQDHLQEKEMKTGKMVVWEGLTNS